MVIEKSIRIVMKKAIFLLLLIFTGQYLDAEEKNHEIWWEKCIGNQISWEQFYRMSGDENDDLRAAIKNHVLQKDYASFLDCGCGMCVDFWNIIFSKPEIDYLGVDITQKFVDRANDLGIKALKGSVENIPVQNNQFEVSFCRHVLDHLDYYQKAIDELIRVAQKEVIIVFLFEPGNQKDEINSMQFYGYDRFYNRYNKSKLESFVLNNPKVKSLHWNKVNKNNTILHIELITQN